MPIGGASRSYGRSSQPLGDFLGQAALSTAITSAVGALFFVGVYALIRRAGARWWLWSGALTVSAGSALMLIAPIAIEPLFNDYKPVPPGEVREALEVLARRAGVPSDRLFVYDGSRQSNNFTANVAGLGGTARIAISDVAFKGASLDEVKAVTAHEAGHYVSGDVWRGIAVISVLAMISFLLADRLYARFARAFGSAAALSDPRGLPVMLFMVSLFMLAATPAMNAMIRIFEAGADRYSLETVNLPDALATALVKTAEYRDPRPATGAGAHLLLAPLGGAARAGGDAVEGLRPGRGIARRAAVAGGRQAFRLRPLRLALRQGPLRPVRLELLPPALRPSPRASSPSPRGARAGRRTIDSAITRLRYHFAFAGTTVHGACFAAVFEMASS